MRKGKGSKPLAMSSSRRLQQPCKTPLPVGSSIRLVILATLLAFAGLSLNRCGPAGKHGPNILFLLVDCLRADHLGLAGYRRPTSPCLDSLAAEGVAFTCCTAQAPFTLASVPSLITGRYPTAAYTRATVSWPKAEEPVVAAQLGQEIPSIPLLLRRHGYVTSMFNASSLVKYRILGLREQFDFCDQSIECACGRCAGRINDLALGWVSSNARRRWFCYIHYMDVHGPYAPPSEFAARFSRRQSTEPALTPGWRDSLLRQNGPTTVEVEHVIDMYDASIAYVDHEICRLLGELKTLGMADDLLVIVLADHGEELFEHGCSDHGQTLYQEQVQCPLLLVWPGRLPKGVCVDQPVMNVDLLPTIADLLGIGTHEGLSGTSLLPLTRGETLERPVFSEMRGSMVRKGTWKLWEDDFSVSRLYDLGSDPAETADLAEALPESVAALGAILPEWKSTLVEPPVQSPPCSAALLDSAAAAKLRALGYAQ
jgi:arylsulfatase A-like enzyme